MKTRQELIEHIIIRSEILTFKDLKQSFAYWQRLADKGYKVDEEIDSVKKLAENANQTLTKGRQ